MTRGCWEITGRYKDDELTFVTWVASSCRNALTHLPRCDSYTARAVISGNVVDSKFPPESCRDFMAAQRQPCTSLYFTRRIHQLIGVAILRAQTEPGVRLLDTAS
jgi:hypothetical protein